MELDKDPALMTDEELNKALNPEDEPDEDDLPDDDEDSKDKDADKPDDDKQDDDDDSDDDDKGDDDSNKDDDKPVSRRQALRIDALLEKLKEKEAPKVPSNNTKSDKTLDYKEALDADDDTIKRLDDDRKAYGEELYLRGLEQAKSMQWNTRLELDAPKVHAKYPQLDKESTEFNPVLAKAVNSMYLDSAGYDAETKLAKNDSLRYNEYVDGLFELADEMGRKKVEESRKNITKQASRTAIRPDGSSVKKRLNLEKAPEAMSDEELDAIIAMAVPPKK